MSVFTSKIPIKDKPPSKHPWDHRIKAKFSSTYKYAHNSVTNPLYPLPEPDNSSDANAVKITVIGNRVRKEFIYCSHLARGLYKYRKKQFKAPVIRGVTSVEWPKVFNDLKIQYGDIASCIKSQVVVLIDDKILGDESELKNLIDSKYVYHYAEYLDYYKEGIEQFANYVKSNGRPCAYLHIAINDKPIGPLIFMLYADIVPLTCQNFLRLCQIKRGGYAGTCIHRIVQDSWIQCGGFGLQNTIELGCENYTVPHDRRGVLAMANAGRNIDCSTQFFVLLQPAYWMKQKYVAFGQLIEGEQTLKKIEDVPTWYESPTAKISIYRAGVFNMDCTWRPINQSTTEYINSHIEDLVQLGTLFYEVLLENVFAIIDEKINAEDEFLTDVLKDEEKNLRRTKRFKHNKEDIENEIKEKSSRGVTSSASSVNNDFDVEVYFEYEIEGEMFPYSASSKFSSHTKPSTVIERPYYLPLTDVPYPGEVDSAFNLQRLLKGNYCHETDLVPDCKKRKEMYIEKKLFGNIPEDILDALFECIEPNRDISESSLDSDGKRELEEYIRTTSDKTSYAGPIIKQIGNIQAKYKILESEEETKKKPIYSDEDLRLMRVAAKRLKTMHCKTVSLSRGIRTASHTKIHRRQTGFVYEDQIKQLEDILANKINEEDECKSDALRQLGIGVPVRSNQELRELDQILDKKNVKKSGLSRLYSDISMQNDDDPPTLKSARHRKELQEGSYAFLTHSTMSANMLGSLDNHNKHICRGSMEMQLTEDVVKIQHGSRLNRKVSSDYVHTFLDRFGRAPNASSIRSVEFAKNRPCLSVVEYKLMNQKYQDELKATRQKIGTSIK